MSSIDPTDSDDSTCLVVVDETEDNPNSRDSMKTNNLNTSGSKNKHIRRIRKKCNPNISNSTISEPSSDQSNTSQDISVKIE